MKRSGLTEQDFWAGFKGNTPQWQVYLDAADYFGMDAWMGAIFGVPTINEPAQVEWKSESVVDKVRDAMVQTTTVKTPDGELKQVRVCPRGDQCGRDTPEENIFAIVEAAKKYGRYDPTTGELPDLPGADK